MSTTRARWAALGAAAAVALGGGGLLTADAGLDSGERAVFVPIAPCRLFDTRPAPDTVGARNTALAPGDTFTAQVTGTNGNCTLPAGAVAVTMNVVVVSPTADSFLTVFPADVARPLASSLNWEAGQAPTPNAVTVELSATGAVNFYNLAGQVHVAVDVVGYHVDHTHDDRYYTKAQADQRVADAVDDRPGWPSRLTAAQVAREQWWADPAKPLTAQVGISPYGMLFDGEHVWVSNNGAGTVTKLVASTGAVVGTYPAGNLPGLMAFDGEHVWVVNGTPNTVTKLDADTGAQVGSALPFATDPSGTFDGDSIWVARRRRQPDLRYRPDHQCRHRGGDSPPRRTGSRSTAPRVGHAHRCGSGGEDRCRHAVPRGAGGGGRRRSTAARLRRPVHVG
ncbi:MAG: hypothetical protein R2713_17185 [Ilumatobacteraceae bacterium]